MTSKVSHRVNLIASALFLIGLAAAPAFAQAKGERPLVFGVDYKFTRFSGEGATNVPGGFGASLSRDLKTDDNGTVAVVGEFDGMFKGYGGGSTSSSQHILSWLGGVRWMGGMGDELRPFASGMVGLSRDTFSSGSFSSSENSFTFLARGGVSKRMDTHAIFFDGFWERFNESSASNAYGFEIGLMFWLEKASS